MHGEGHHPMEEISSAEAAEKMREGMEKHPEKFPFTTGEKVLVTDPETGKQTVETFIAWDPTEEGGGKAIVTVEEGKGINRVEGKNLQKAS